MSQGALQSKHLPRKTGALARVGSLYVGFFREAVVGLEGSRLSDSLAGLESNDFMTNGRYSEQNSAERRYGFLSEASKR